MSEIATSALNYCVFYHTFYSAFIRWGREHGKRKRSYGENDELCFVCDPYQKKFKAKRHIYYIFALKKLSWEKAV